MECTGQFINLRRIDKNSFRLSSVKQPHRQREKHSDKQSDIQTGRQAGIKTVRQTGSRKDSQTGSHTDRQSQRQTVRQAVRQTGSQKNRHSGRQAGRQAGRQKDSQTESHIFGKRQSDRQSDTDRQKDRLKNIISHGCVLTTSMMQKLRKDSNSIRLCAYKPVLIFSKVSAEDCSCILNHRNKRQQQLSDPLLTANFRTSLLHLHSCSPSLASI